MSKTERERGDAAAADMAPRFCLLLAIAVVLASEQQAAEPSSPPLRIDDPTYFQQVRSSNASCVMRHCQCCSAAACRNCVDRRPVSTSTQGEQFGVPTNWTSCTNWSGYTWHWRLGNFHSWALPTLLTLALPCSDGPCNDDRDDYLPSAGSYTYDDAYDAIGHNHEPSASATECTCPTTARRR